jgi:hypothetical protein
LIPPLPPTPIVVEGVYWPALAKGSTTSAELKATTSPVDVVMAGSESEMAPRTAISNALVRSALQLYESWFEETCLSRRKDIPSAGAGMAIGLANARAMRDARAKMENCMIAIFEDQIEMVEKECIGKKSTGDE